MLSGWPSPVEFVQLGAAALMLAALLTVYSNIMVRLARSEARVAAGVVAEALRVESTAAAALVADALRAEAVLAAARVTAAAQLAEEQRAHG